MLNAEKYREEIFREAKKETGGFPLACSVQNISNVVGYENTIKWLLSEYKPPWLKNGDDLKPGDWIMVRDRLSEPWLKKQFAYYYCGSFYCSATDYALSTGICFGWNYARLPEKGE